MQKTVQAFILAAYAPPTEITMSEEYIEIELEEEPIELCKLLKVLDLVDAWLDCQTNYTNVQ